MDPTLSLYLYLDRVRLLITEMLHNSQYLKSALFLKRLSLKSVPESQGGRVLLYQGFRVPASIDLETHPAQE
jgi:hypothetical protein